MWRVGARLMTKQLQSWMLTWANHRTLGGVPRRSVHDFHTRYAALFEDDGAANTEVVCQDIQKFFDALDIGQVAKVLKRLGAPAPWINLLVAFYNSCRRIFAVQGAYNKSWAGATRGLLQGCPFSPILAAAVSHLWAVATCWPDLGVDGAAFLDDRTVWRLPGFSTLHAALRRSVLFDRCFGLRLCLTQMPSWHRRNSRSCGNQLHEPRLRSMSPFVEVLGVRYDMTQLSLAKPLKFDMDMAQRRLELIRHVTPCLAHRRLLISWLVKPMFCWIAGWAHPTSSELASLRTETLLSFGGRLHALVCAGACREGSG